MKKVLMVLFVFVLVSIVAFTVAVEPAYAGDKGGKKPSGERTPSQSLPAGHQDGKTPGKSHDDVPGKECEHGNHTHNPHCPTQLEPTDVPPTKEPSPEPTQPPPTQEPPTPAPPTEEPSPEPTQPPPTQEPPTPAPPTEEPEVVIIEEVKEVEKVEDCEVNCCCDITITVEGDNNAPIIIICGNNSGDINIGLPDNESNDISNTNVVAGLQSPQTQVFDLENQSEFDALLATVEEQSKQIELLTQLVESQPSQVSQIIITDTIIFGLLTFIIVITVALLFITLGLVVYLGRVLKQIASN